MKGNKDKKTGLIIAAIVVAGMALSGIAVVKDGPESLSFRRPEPLPVAGAAASRPDPAHSRGQYIDPEQPDLTPEHRRGMDWTAVPGTPHVVPRVRYADGEPVAQHDVADVLGYNGEKVRNPRASSGGPRGQLPAPISADQFWAGMSGPDGSPMDVAPIPGASSR